MVMRVVEAQQIVAISYRLSALRSMRALAGAGLLVLIGIAFARHSWLAAVTGVALAGVISVLVSNDATDRVARITGMSRAAQASLWSRYRKDAAFAVRVKVALANDGLSRALDEITRSLNGESTAGNIKQTLQAD